METINTGPKRVDTPISNKAIKCVVWDLDNTLWHGTLAEGDDVKLKDGVVDVIKALDARGVLHSIASKNNHDDVVAKLEAFGLLDYFLYPQINWNPKSSSVEKIREKLNIGIDTFLFIDDQPFEREEVSAIHPEVECIDAEFYLILEEMERIKSGAISDDAAMRRIRYLEDMERQTEEEKFIGTPEGFLATLNMKFKIAEAGPMDLIRAEELTLRTNQLNSTGITYSHDELKEYMESDSHQLLVCELTDKYGSYGKIGLVLVEIKDDVMMIKLLLMSCRVAARGAGSVLLTYLIKHAVKNNYKLRANFRRTPRNRQMLVTYQFSGFKEIDKDEQGNILFEHDLSAQSEYPNYVQLIIE
ncbi:HAD family hydrolase [Pleionea sp. CnH1-48]|uniref:HAD-IIIC family phosphatase n=1 Tax=Pleionea sp. CnH1-48 TaxID=2954494 RepID=UPI002096B747|nr:HAD-IIIC family phosphatase [Pleionea sp. CnH1-48]MCO7224342.1 HAD-IIIC family phosphatase [Pleionea sp. CnH1-48]